MHCEDAQIPQNQPERGRFGSPKKGGIVRGHCGRNAHRAYRATRKKAPCYAFGKRNSSGGNAIEFYGMIFHKDFSLFSAPD